MIIKNKKLVFFVAILLMVTIKANAQATCPQATVQLSKNYIFVTHNDITVSAPEGFVGGTFQPLILPSSFFSKEMIDNGLDITSSFVIINNVVEAVGLPNEGIVFTDGIEGKGWTYTPNGATNCNLLPASPTVYDIKPLISPLTQTTYGQGSAVYYTTDVNTAYPNTPPPIFLTVIKFSGPTSLQFDIWGDAIGYDNSATIQSVPSFSKTLAVYGVGSFGTNQIRVGASYNSHSHFAVSNFVLQEPPTIIDPDLVTQSLATSGSLNTGASVSFTGVVRNSGTSSAGASTARFCIDNASCLTSTTGRVGNDISVSALNAGVSSGTLTSSSVWTATAGNHTLYFCADVGGAVTESSESNNCSSLPFTITSTSGGETLSVSKTGTGFGTITSNTGGINCGATCAASYATGTSVVLTATPSNSTFTGWTGACINSDVTPLMTSSSAPSPNATAASSVGFSLYSYYGFDHSTASTKGWGTPQGTLSGWLRYDFGAGNTKRVTAYKISSLTNLTDRNPEDWTFQGSNDASSWTTLDTQVDQKPWVASQSRSYGVSNPGSYRYYRLNISDAWQNYALVVGELELMESVGTGTCTVTVDTSKTITANFTSNATVTIDSGDDEVPYNTSTIINWSSGGATSCEVTCAGDCVGWTGTSGSRSTGNLTSPRIYTVSCDSGAATDTVTVNVEPQSTSSLTIEKTGQGAVTGTPNSVSTPNQANINCGTICTANYVEDTDINLYINAEGNRIIASVTGCDSLNKVSNTQNICSITDFSSNRLVRVSFIADPNYNEF